ncbi:MAG: DUF3696 domain-containing protein [Magnetococcales bacterium]|nr:DUF3696 domain-containing protein [Magnetococcales bacterium]
MLSQLKLRNFKCFAEQTFNLSALNLLTGLNGTGKSSVLQSMLLLRQSHEMGVLDREGLALNGHLVRLGTAKDVFFEDSKEEIIEIGLRDKEGSFNNFVYSYDETRDFLQSATPTEVSREVISGMNLFSDQFHYLQAERIGPRQAFPMSDQHVRVHGQVGADGEFTSHFLNLYGTRKVPPKLRHPRATNDTLRSQVEAWLGEISPGVRIWLASHVDMDLIKLGFSFSGSRHTTGEFRSTSVGFGLSYVLPILVAILSSTPGALILQENPEAHLHPRGQGKMGELIALAAATGIQLIVESHSDHILNGIRIAVRQGHLTDGNTAFFFFSKIDKDGYMCSQVETPTIDGDGRMDYWPDGFFDEWEKSLENLF